MHTCSYNSVLGIPEFVLQQQEGPAEGEDLEEAVNAPISTLSKKLSAKWKANNNVSKLYLRKSQRKIQDQGFYCVFLSSNHRKYLEELETTFCGEFHRNWKISGKIRTKDNRNSRDLRDHHIQPCHSDTERKQARESFTAGWRSYWAEYPHLLTPRIIF